MVEALVAAFELPTPENLAGDDKEAAEILRLQAESQVEMTPEQLAEFVAALEDAEAQGEVTQVRQGTACAPHEIVHLAKTSSKRMLVGR